MVAENGTVDLQQLRAFVEVANRGGVTAAADALMVAKSGVSRQLAALEAGLRMRLVERSSKRVALTQEGQRLLPRAESILAELDRLLTDAHEDVDGVRGTVRIAAPPEFAFFLAKHLLPPLLSRFPELRALLSISYDLNDLHDPSIDLAFRLGNVADDRLIARPLGTFSRLLVCSEGFAKEHVIAEPDDLSGVNALIFSDQYSSGTWSLEKGGNPTTRREIGVSGRLGIRSFSALSSAAEVGLGVAHLPSFFVRPKLEEGALHHLLPNWSSPRFTAYIAYRPNVARIRRVRAVIDLATEVVIPALAG